MSPRIPIYVCCKVVFRGQDLGATGVPHSWGCHCFLLLSWWTEPGCVLAHSLHSLSSLCEHRTEHEFTPSQIWRRPSPTPKEGLINVTTSSNGFLGGCGGVFSFATPSDIIDINSNPGLSNPINSSISVFA